MERPSVKVRDLETDHEYVISESRYKRTPDLWERLGSEPQKPRTSVSREAAKKKAASPAATPKPDASAPGQKADEPADKKE